MQYPTTRSLLFAAAMIAALGACSAEGNDGPDSSTASAEQTTPAEVDATAPEAPAVVADAPDEAPAEQEPAETDPDEPRELGTFQLTYYWMAEARDHGAATVPIYQRKSCNRLATVSKSFAHRLTLEGTGKLRDGRVVNTAGACHCDSSPCFFVVKKYKKWGVGVGKRPLVPYRSVAVDPGIVPVGTMLYIPQLDGLTMPGHAPYGGFVHDGCVRADDRGGNINGKQLDLFMGKRSHYRAFFHRNRLKTLTVLDGSHLCERKGRTVAKANRNSI